MSARVLSMRRIPAYSVDVSALIPERLLGLDETAIGEIELSGGLRAADVFDIGGEDAQHLVIRNGSEQLSHVGNRMNTGAVTVEGDCGAYAGLGMRGGKLTVTGSAGPFAGCEMRAGLLEIRGDAGDFIGSALPGNKQGMRGGTIVIHGNAGDRTGDRMRRGLILIAGNAGAYCGARMLAGTILIQGRVGFMPGLALKRGTLLLTTPPAELPATFQDSGEHVLLFLTLLENEMRRQGAPFVRFLPLAKRVRRYCGDLANGAAGEILVFT